MSQKRTGFQSKPKFGGQKFGGKGKGRGGPPGGGFGKRSEGDSAPRRSFGDRPERSGGDRPERKPSGDSRKPYGDKPRGAWSKDRDSRPARPRDGDSKPWQKRAPSGDRPERKEYSKPRGDRPSYGGDRERKPYGDKPRGDRPYQKREFNDRPPRDRGGEDRPYKKREFGGDRPERKEYGGDKPYTKRPFRDDNAPRGDRPDRPFKKREFGGDKPFEKRAFRDSSAPRGRDNDAPRGDRPDRGGKPFEKKPFRNDRDRAPQKTFTRYEEAAPASFETRQKLKSERAQYGAPSSAYLYGAHAVTEALLNPKRVHQRLLVTLKGHETLQEVILEATAAGINVPEPIFVEREDIERLLPRDAVHQDMLLDSQPLEEIFLVDILINAPENAKILVLDQVTDPHNVGAILRSAAAFGATAVVAQKIHAPDITGTLAKVASGAVEHVPFVREVNLSRALEQLKEAGFFCIGLAEEGKRTLSDLKLSGGKVALVLGAEGEGLRRLVSENCDELVKLPTQGRIASLNVSNAAAVALYEVTR